MVASVKCRILLRLASWLERVLGTIWILLYSKTEIMTTTTIQLKCLLQNFVNFLETGCLFYSSSWTQTCCDPSASGSWVLGFRTQFNKLPKATVLIYKERSTKFHTKTFKCLKCPYVSLISIFIRDIYSLTSLLKLYTEQLIFPVKDKAHPQTFVFNSAKTIFFRIPNKSLTVKKYYMEGRGLRARKMYKFPPVEIPIKQ